MDDDNELSPVERMALSARSSEPSPEPSLKAISLRVSMSTLAGVDAFVALTGQSRNTAMINLLEAGIYAVREQLDDSDAFDCVREQLFEQYSGD